MGDFKIGRLTGEIPLRSRDRASRSCRRNCALPGRTGRGPSPPILISPFLLSQLCCTYNHPPVDANDKVEPRLDGQVGVGVAQDLEAKGAVVVAGGRRQRLAVEARDESVECVEHGGRTEVGPVQEVLGEVRLESWRYFNIVGWWGGWSHVSGLELSLRGSVLGGRWGV